MVGSKKVVGPTSGVSELDEDLDSSSIDFLKEHSTIKVVRVGPFIVGLGWYWRSNSPNSISHLTRCPDMCCEEFVGGVDISKW
jgi:hypothetical protein